METALLTDTDFLNTHLWETDMSGIISDCALRHQLAFAPLCEDLNREVRRYGPDFITTDGIHLTSEGHRIIAEKFLPLLLL